MMGCPLIARGFLVDRYMNFIFKAIINWIFLLPAGVARSKMVISGSLSTGPDSCECYESIMYEMSTDTSSSSVSSKPIVSSSEISS